MMCKMSSPPLKGYANPITVFANMEKILAATERHVARQGTKPAPSRCDRRRAGPSRAICRRLGRPMGAAEDLTAEERETLELVQELIASGNLHPLIARLRAGEAGPEHARDALKVLGDLDLDMLVQLALDTLIDQYVADAGLAHQTRRESRGGDDAPSA